MKITLSALAAFTVLASPAATTQQESALVESMKKVGSAWSALASTQEPIIVSCPSGGFKAMRIRRGSAVSFDLRKTESMMNPLVGLVFINGSIETNSSSYDGSCLPTPDAARQHKAFHGNDRVYSMQAVFQLQDGKWKFSSGNEVFMNQIGNDFPRFITSSSATWRTATGW